jgi:3-dehydroquinate dehydratase-1/3-dehydroquinate dehydratase/shikimate dehydrogenase
MERGKICVSIAAADAAAVHAAVLPVREQVDVVEVRLDAMPVPEVAKCCALIRKPLLFTHRPFWEGGTFNGFEEDRLEPLFTAVELQAAYVDFELRADPLLRRQLLDEMQSAPTRMIISWHDFTATPTAEELSELLEQMLDSGAQIGKIVTTAHEPSDVLRVLSVQEKAHDAEFPLSCFCMGEPGRISRFATLFLGGYMSYGASGRDLATAPGQLSVGQLDSLCQIFQESYDG